MTELEQGSRLSGRRARPALARTPLLPWTVDGLPHSIVRAVLGTSLVGIIACDHEGVLTMRNDVAAAWQPAELDPDVGPGDRARYLSLYDPGTGTLLEIDQLPLARTLAEGVLRGVEVLVAPPGQVPRLALCEGRVLTGEAGEVVGAVVLFTEVTEVTETSTSGVGNVESELRATSDALRRTAEALAVSEDRFRAAFHHGPMAMCAVDAEGVVSRVNPALRRLLALPTHRLLGQPLAALVAPADRNRLAVAMAANGSAQLVAEPVEVRLECPDGRRLWCELGTIRIADGAVHALVSLADIDGRKHREGRVDRRAGHDALTGLTSRLALTMLLADLLAPGEHDGDLALLYVDIDPAGAGGDSPGSRRAGRDDVVLEVADRLLHSVRPHDLVARVDRTEFVILCKDLDGPAARGLVRRLHRALEAPVPLPGGAVTVASEIVVTRAVPGDDSTALLARADATTTGRRPGSCRPPAALTSVATTTAGSPPRLGELVDTAVRDDRLLVLHQPVVDLRTGLTVGSEALLRMRNQAGVIIDPDAFIPLAEASGAIHGIGDWVLFEACRQAAGFKRRLPPDADFGIGVNLSPRQLDDPHLLVRIETALAESGLDPGALVLELTERLLTTDTAHVRTQLADIRSLGVHLAADDFGTGYASVRYLADLPLDVIKIDRSWTARLGEDSRLGRLADGVARLAASTGLVTIVEGVETESERAAVLAHGLTLAQGYLFARPLTVDDIGARLFSPPY